MIYFLSHYFCFSIIDQEQEFLKISKQRRQEIENITIRMDYCERICKTADGDLQQMLELHENRPYYGVDLPIR